MYSVVGADGQVYGPVDMATLSQWIAEGRIVETTNLIDPLDGRVLQAGQAPALMGTFPTVATTPPRPPTMTIPGPHLTPGPTNVGHQPYGGYPRGDMAPYAGPPKSKLVAILLALFLGGFGIHRFYLGHAGTGVALLLLTIFVSWWTCGIITFVWCVVDVILIATGALRESNGRELT